MLSRARFEDRFWEKVERLPNGCWVWTGGKTTKGYGALQFDKRKLLAHRVSFEMEHGSIPDGAHICHHCDNPPCVNPDHLYAGDYASNVADKMARGRWAGGRFTRLGRPLTDWEREYIVICRRGGVAYREIARHIGITDGTVRNVYLRETAA